MIASKVIKKNQDYAKQKIPSFKLSFVLF